MKTEITKTEAGKKVEQFFSDLHGKTPEQIKKTKRLAMHHHVSLHQYKQLFCKKCLTVFNLENIKRRIKKEFKVVTCKKCGFVGRHRLKKS